MSERDTDGFIVVLVITALIVWKHQMIWGYLRELVEGVLVSDAVVVPVPGFGGAGLDLARLLIAVAVLVLLPLALRLVVKVLVVDAAWNMITGRRDRGRDH